MNNRLLGALCMIGGLAYTISGLLIQGMPQPEPAPAGPLSLLVNLLLLVSAAGFFCGALGIFNLRVTGDHIVARALTGIPFITLPVLMMAAVLLMAGMRPPALVLVIGLVGTLLGMTTIGILAVITKRWAGWRKLTPFGHLVALLLALPVGMIINIPVGIAYLAIGYAVLTSVPVRQASATAQPA